MTEGTAEKRLHPSALTRLRWWAFYLVLRLTVGAAFFFAAMAIARWVGIWLTLPIVACAAAAVCGFVAMELSRNGGRVSYINRLAVIILPIGLRVGGGRLLRMFAWSSALWSVVGMAGAIYGGLRSRGADHASTHAPVLRVLLVASLIVDGACFILLAQQAVNRLTLNSPGMKPVAIFLAVLLALMVGGVGLWMAGLPWAAVLLAGGPPAVVGGFYGVFFVVLFASHPRWN